MARLPFRNRDEAAHGLVTALENFRGQHPVVLGVPRGAVPMARVIADALHADVDVVLVRKLRAPGQPELALGAVDERGQVIAGDYFDIASDEYLCAEIGEQQRVLRERRAEYNRVHVATDLTGRIVILVDDGVATGSSMESAIRLIRTKKPARIVVAVGVAPVDTVARLRLYADEVVCLNPAQAFGAVGEFYDDFSDVTDVQVLDALAAPTSTLDGGGGADTQRTGDPGATVQGRLDGTT